ncbi:hypothetical protein ACPOL_4641 [Acidisarcina polymorpha]|uniref:DUF4038 domain-containing protein n=2 Tax=Acidisarcina polymorpha TaxID=2211140 RepID=A0A2Z5G400_9BACT|nr:hypothetical protein ACPOL_4641 [Acidisarcina polymorpha]
MLIILMAWMTVNAAALGGESKRDVSTERSLYDLKVSPNHHFLIHPDGTPFFYLGDTAWELFHRLTLEESERYLEDRRSKDFNVIQAVVLAEPDGLNVPNADGERPLIDNDPTKPNEAYFNHVDAVVDMAAKKGLYIGMLPTWGDKVVKAWGTGPVIFNADNARAYGRYLGSRYQDRWNIIWTLGGDRDPAGHEQVFRAMAEGLREGDGGRHLMTYHPPGERSSSEWFDRDDWLDFNMEQSGHGHKDGANYKMIEADYALTPLKPVIDGEPRYEDHPVAWKPEQFGWFDDYDVRQAAYWAVFAGAAGHTYGCNDIWQFKTPTREPISLARGEWTSSLNLRGAGQMRYLRGLLESRPYLSRVPDQSLLSAPQSDGADHMQATRGDGYALVYFPSGKPASIALDGIAKGPVRAAWYDPRTGAAHEIAVMDGIGHRTFTPPGLPGRGNDWVLVLDAVAKHFGALGESTAQK